MRRHRRECFGTSIRVHDAVCEDGLGFSGGLVFFPFADDVWEFGVEANDEAPFECGVADDVAGGFSALFECGNGIFRGHREVGKATDDSAGDELELSGREGFGGEAEACPELVFEPDFGEVDVLIGELLKVGAELRAPAGGGLIELLECLAAPVLDGGIGLECVWMGGEVDGLEDAGHRPVTIEAGVEGAERVEL